MRAVLALLLAIVAGPLPAQDAIGRVNVAGYNARSMCSGTLVAPDLVLTAAHCVARARDGVPLPVADMVFVAGWDGAHHAGAARAASVLVHPLAFADGPLDIAHDLALITLSAALELAPLPVGTAPVEGPFTLAGYRRSRPHRLNIQQGCAGQMLGEMWRIACDVEKGQSGGPVLFGADGARRIVAVVAGRRPGEALSVPADDWLRAAVAAQRR